MNKQMKADGAYLWIFTWVLVCVFVAACGKSKSSNRIYTKEELKQLNQANKVQTIKETLKKLKGLEFNRIQDQELQSLGEFSFSIDTVEAAAGADEAADDTLVYTIRIKGKDREAREERGKAKINPDAEKLYDLELGSTGQALFWTSQSESAEPPTCVQLSINAEAPLFKDIEMPKHPVGLCRTR